MLIAILIFVILIFLALTAIHAKLGEIHTTLKTQEVPWPKREGL